MSSQSFVLSEEAAQELRNRLWDAESILRLLVDHAEMQLNAPGERHNLDGLPAVLKAAAEKVGNVSSRLECFNLPRLGQGGSVLPARSAEVTPLRKGVGHA